MYIYIYIYICIYIVVVQSHRASEHNSLVAILDLTHANCFKESFSGEYQVCRSLYYTHVITSRKFQSK